MDAYIPVSTDGTHNVQVQLIHGDICNDDVDAVGIYRILGDVSQAEVNDCKKEEEVTGATGVKRSTQELIKGEILRVKLPQLPGAEQMKLPNLNFIQGLTNLTHQHSGKQTKMVNILPKATETSLKLLHKAGDEVELQYKALSSKNRMIAVRGVVITSGGRLNQKRILHLNVTDNPDHLQETVMSALKMADKEKIRSLSFPALPMVLQHGTNIRNMFETFEQYAKQERPRYLNFIRVVVSETRHELPSYMNAREVHELQLYRDVMTDDVNMQTDTNVDIGAGSPQTLHKQSPKLIRQQTQNSVVKDNIKHLECIEMAEFDHDHQHHLHVKLPSDYSEMDTIRIGRPSEYDSQTVSTSTSSDTTTSSGSSETSSNDDDDSNDDDEAESHVEETGYKKYSDSIDASGEMDLGLGQQARVRKPRVIADLQLPSIPVSRLDLDPIQIGEVITKVTRVHNSGNNNQALINFAHPEEDDLGGMEIADGVTKISVGSRTMFNITLSNDPGKFPRLRTMIQATLREANREGFRQVSLPGNAVPSQYIQAPYGWRINPAKIYPLLCYQAINDFALYDYQPAILNTINIVVDDRQTLEMYDQVRKVFENFRVKATRPERTITQKRDMCCRWYCYWRLFTFGYAFTVELNHPDRLCCCCSRSDSHEETSMRDRVGSLREQNVLSTFL